MRAAYQGKAGMEMNGSSEQVEESIGSVTQARLAELRMIERENGGILQPEMVVEFASNPKTALHSAFEWNDTAAARKYRIEQARQIIRITVDYTPHTAEPVKAFIALRSDRYDEGGYRHMPTLMKSAEGRDAVLQTALWELAAFQEKYKQLKELADVFEAIRKTRKKVA